MIESSPDILDHSRSEDCTITSAEPGSEVDTVAPGVLTFL